ADRPRLPGLARRQASIVLLGQPRRAVSGGVLAAIVVVDGGAIAIVDHDVARRHGRLVVAPPDALTLTLALSQTLPLSLSWCVVVAMPLAGRSDAVGRTAAAGL